MSMSTFTRPPAAVLKSDSQVFPADERKQEPVVYWAVLGGLMLAFTAYIVIRWVTGPYFKSVPGGVTQPPTAMKIALLAVQIGGPGVALFCIYWFLIRPWRRLGRPTTEGLLTVCYSTLYIQDPVSNAGGYWFTYNTTAFNRGSWIPYLPLFNAPTGRPGHMFAEPIFAIGSGYVYFWVIGVGVAMFAFRQTKKRWPKVGTAGAIVAAYVGGVVFDIVLEPFVWTRTGFYAYPGAPGPRIFSSSYMAYPVWEGLIVGLLLLPYVLLRYYKDDKGYSVVERGVDNLRLGKKAKVAVRFLALMAASQLIYFFAYNMWVYQLGTNAQTWNKEVQQRSYFLDGICGQGTNRLCASPAVPNSRPHSVYVGANGKLVVPVGVKLPAAVPVLRGKH
jgi:Spirocyclase AveC-like